MARKRDLHKELKQVNQKIDSFSTPSRFRKVETFGNYLLVFVLLVVGAFTLIRFPGITGLVTFSESVVKAQTSEFSVQRSGTVDITTDMGDINSLMLSGTVYGDGKASVFLVRPERKYLAYYFEGDASEGVQFNDMCYDTCHLEGLGKDNTLLFELQNTQINISRIKYVYSRIIDMDMEPKTQGIDYRTDPVKMIDLKLTNRELADYTVLLYIDGPLSSSFSWQGSLIHMSRGEPEKTVSITMILPDNLTKGTYTHKITARYVPPDTHDFVGESPVAESFITVYNE